MDIKIQVITGSYLNRSFGHKLLVFEIFYQKGIGAHTRLRLISSKSTPDKDYGYRLRGNH